MRTDIRATDIFGGLVDILGDDKNFADIVAHFKTSALLFDSIVVQDSWFLCRGPIARHLLGLGSDRERWERDDFVRLVASGIIKIALRNGTSLLDVWNSGTGAGVTPGQFLFVSKEEGDKFVPMLAEFAATRGRSVSFPPPITSENKSLFGAAVEKFLFPKNKIEKRSGYFYLDADVPEIRNFIDGFSNFVSASMSEKFRRGQVEDYVGRALGMSSFDYNALHKASHDSLKGQAALALMEDLSTLYAATQASLFQVRPQAFAGHDSGLMEDYLLGVEQHIRTGETMPNCVLDLRSAISPDRLTANDILFIRNQLDDGRLFASALSLVGACARTTELDAFVQLASFLEHQYIPAIIKARPYLNVEGAGLWISNKGRTLERALHKVEHWVDTTRFAFGIMGVASEIGAAIVQGGISDFIETATRIGRDFIHFEEAEIALRSAKFTTRHVIRGIETGTTSAHAKIQAYYSARAQRRVRAWYKDKSEFDRNDYLI